MAYRTDREVVEGVEVFALSDSSTGARAVVAPALGFNLFRLHLPVSGRITPILVEPPSLAELKANPSSYGHPILFPFPNRICEGRFVWQGKPFATPVNASGHAIHGYALRSAWRVVAEEATADGASVTAQWRLSTDAPEHCDHWPADAQIEVTYRLTSHGVAIDAVVSNPSAVDLPWGLGYHTYFRLPLSSETSTDDTRIVVPAARRWVLDGFLPTGEKQSLPASLDLRNGLSLKNLKADDVLTDLEHGADGRVECRLQDTKQCSEVIMTTSREFTEMVVFTPTWNPNAIALEPYTQTTDAVNLASRGIEGGLRILKSGESQALSVRILTRQITG